MGVSLEDKVSKSIVSSSVKTRGWDFLDGKVLKSVVSFPVGLGSNI